MTASVSVAVMHVPGAGRDENVQRILAALPSEWGAVVVEDQARRGPWPTARRAWANAGVATHHLVLQDDVEVCDHFDELLLGAIAARPQAVMSLCTRARMPVEDAVVQRLSWLHSADGVYGQGIVIPTASVPDMLAWVARHVPPNYAHDDGRVGMWARATQRGVYTPVPQLVRHIAGPSLLGHLPAHGLGTPLFAADRRDVNWDTAALEVEGTLFGGGGLRADVANALARLPQRPSNPSSAAQARASERLDELRRRFRGGA